MTAVAYIVLISLSLVFDSHWKRIHYKLSLFSLEIVVFSPLSVSVTLFFLLLFFFHFVRFFFSQWILLWVEFLCECAVLSSSYSWTYQLFWGKFLFSSLTSFPCDFISHSEHEHFAKTIQQLWLHNKSRWKEKLFTFNFFIFLRAILYFVCIKVSRGYYTSFCVCFYFSTFVYVK